MIKRITFVILLSLSFPVLVVANAMNSNAVNEKISFTEFAKCEGVSDKGKVLVTVFSMDSTSNFGLIRVDFFPMNDEPDEGGLDSQLTDFGVATLENIQESLLISGNKFKINFALVDDRKDFRTKVYFENVEVANKISCSI